MPSPDEYISDLVKIHSALDSIAYDLKTPEGVNLYSQVHSFVTQKLAYYVKSLPETQSELLL